MCLYPKRISPHLQVLKNMPEFIPCGKCIECVQAKSREWASRIMQEASLYEHNCCVTLTYEDNPVDLVPKDLQGFMKRLRSLLSPKKIRFFVCGEYGGKGNRPHYHVILFDWIPDDLEYFYTRNRQNYYKSEFLRKTWSHGHILVGELNPKTALYCAKYMQKFDEREHKVPPFTRMSLRPGIGAAAFDPVVALQTGKQYIAGHEFRLPRYYQKILDRDGYDLTQLKQQRRINTTLFAPSDSELEVRREKVRQVFGKTTYNDTAVYNSLIFKEHSYEDQKKILREVLDREDRLRYNDDNP